MKKIIGNILLKLMGWRVELEGDPKYLNRCVLVVAPHTSNWDYYLGVLAYWKLGKRLKIIIKDSHTKAFYGKLVKKIGAMGINRRGKEGVVQQVVEYFKKDSFSLVITPEGSRSYSEKWKLGFYHIAIASKLPIVLATGDYKRKRIKIGYTLLYEKLEKSSLENVLKEIEDYFKVITPKFPKKYNPKIY